jgi:putative transposase
VTVKENKLYFTKFMDGIVFDNHRIIEGEVQNATITKNPAGQYFACIGVTRDIHPEPKTDKTIGIDLGIKTLVVGSDGTTHPNIEPYRNLEKLIAQRTKAYERTKRVKTDEIDSDGKNIVKDSKGRVKAREYLAKVYNRAANIRSNHLHQISSKIVNENQVIVMEDLNVSGMIKNRKLSKSIWDCSWSELARQIIYKAEWYGRTVVKIDRFYPSSKTCGDEGEVAGCGYINGDLTLADREWTCPRCGLKHDRDRNAANNILRQGLNLINQNRSGTTGLAECLGVRPNAQKAEGNRLARKSGCSKGDGSPLSETQPSLAAG